jgi:hypothetical protein
MINTLERFHIDNETKTDNKINDNYTVRPYINFDKLIPKYTNRGQSPVKLPLPIATLLSHKLQHNQHARYVLPLNSIKTFNYSYTYARTHTHNPIFTVIRHLPTLSTCHFRAIFKWKKLQ